MQGRLGEGAREEGNDEASRVWNLVLYTFAIRPCRVDGPKLKRGYEEMGMGTDVPSPPPPSLMGTIFTLIRSSRGSKFSHTCPLMEEFPAVNRGMGACCHP
jgi:hypothetical protein